MRICKFTPFVSAKMLQMKKLSVTVFALLVILSTATSEPSAEPTILTECGQTARANSGRIEYKLDQFYDSDELCPFIIRTETVGDLVFTLESHGINQTSDPFPINIFTFSESGFMETAHLGAPNPLNQAYVTGSIAVVVFKTKEGKNVNRGTGFKLSFNAVLKHTNFGVTGQDHIFTNVSNTTAQEMTLPFWEEPGRNRANVIVLSAGGKAVTDVFSSLRVTFLRENLEKHINVADCGYDSIDIYTFTSENLRHEQRFCSLLYHPAVYATKGLMILVFKDFQESYWNSFEATFQYEIVRS